MMTVELDDETALLLSQLIQQEHLDAAQLVKQALADYRGPLQTARAGKKELMSDIIATLPSLPTFTGAPLAIQKALRDEWD